MLHYTEPYRHNAPLNRTMTKQYFTRRYLTLPSPKLYFILPYHNQTRLSFTQHYYTYTKSD